VTEFHAHDRVGVGLVDPYFTQLANSMRGKWRPKVADAGGSDNNGALGQLANLVQSWNAVGKQYAATGSPFPAADTPLPADARPVQRDPAGNSGYDAADFLTRWNAGEFAFSGGLVLVELTQAPEGQPISVKVVQSSGSKKLDESAKRSVLEAARVADAPPKHGLGLGGPNIRSLWEMQARMVSNTCVPATDPTGDTNGNKGAGALPGLMCGGTFDIAMGTFDVNAPGQTRVVTHVVLMAVYGGEAGPYEGKPDQTATQ
jgi:TonB family protein